MTLAYMQDKPPRKGTTVDRVSCRRIDLLWQNSNTGENS
jgi:hypothetical protein